MVLFTERHQEEIAGAISGYDRRLIQGPLPGLCWAQGMRSYRYARQLRRFDYPRFAPPRRAARREHVARGAAENELEREFIRRTKRFRQAEKVPEVGKPRGDHPGLV